MWCKYILLLLLASHGLALNILAIFSGPYWSHYLAFEPLLRALAKTDHSVTVINNFPDTNPTPNMKFVDLQQKNFPHFVPLTFFEDITFPRLLNYEAHWEMVPYQANITCEILLTNRNAKAHLAEKVKYDVIFVEQFAISDCDLVYAATVYDAPLIGLSSHVLLPEAYPRLGIPFDYAADSFYYSVGGPNPSILYKIEALLGNLYLDTIRRWVLQSNVYESFRRHMPHVTFDIEQLARDRLKMMFVYQHPSVTGARLSSPQVLDVGGLHVSEKKSLDKDIEQFLSSAKHGVVYVSFGSNLKASTMSPHKLEQFLAAFKSIPQKVLWKWEGDSFPAGHDNVLTRKWFPQVDVLCHPKVVAFVSHGGMLSVSESAYCGKPLLAVPFFGDQFSNAASVQASGLGRLLYFQHITAETLSVAVKELTSAEMQQSAKRVSELFRDRPQPVLDSAIYWTEYVARHRAAPPALPSTHNTWFETALLDVYTVLIAIAFLLYWICYLIYKLIRLICRFICRKVCKRKVKKH